MQLKFVSTTPDTLVSTKTCLEQLSELTDKLVTNGQSQEGLTNITLATIDIFGRLVNNLRTIVFKAFRTLKRSELRTFSDSNITRIAALEKMHYGMYTNQKVYIPSGMIVTFPTAVECLQDAYQTANALFVLKQAIKEMRLIHTAILRGITPVESVTGTLTQDREDKVVSDLGYLLKNVQGIESVGLDVIEKADEVASSIFSVVKPVEGGVTIVIDLTGNQIEMAPFTKQFRSMEEFRTVRKSLLEFETQLTAVAEIEKLTDELDQITKSVQRTLESGQKPPSPETIDFISKYVRRIAVCVSYQGYANATQMVLEHNHVLNLTSLFSLI